MADETDLSRMTAEQRLAEVSAILAAAILRLRRGKSGVKIQAESHQNSLGCRPEIRPHVANG